MRNTYAADPTEVWDEEEDLNITRELNVAKTAGMPARDCGTEIIPPAHPSERWEQDTQPVDGEAALHPPPGSELIERGKIQG